ncbi:MAG: 23S rRNA (cytosine(1962)-C(5))-methyltransferase RlmI [Chloroflexi bacterium]|nr:23S rRNA (cytosine(1962)-C(5))-methyltransferase RlmI [Chloroflexota bacterium]
MVRVVLKRGREKPVLNRHPWIFSGAIQRVEGEAADGDVVAVADYQGRFLARGYLNRRSQIAVRLLTWDEGEVIEGDFWRRRLGRAFASRRGLADDPATDAYRLVNAESDLLPGLVLDRYGDYLVAQFLTLGIERWKADLVGLIADLLPPRGIYERSDVEVREKEGLAQVSGLLHGEEPPGLVQITENGHRFLVDIKTGHKTGFYLDQRENREKLARYCPGKEVLNCFAYTGAFAVYAAAAGAGRITNVESSAEALELARRNVALNGFAEREDEYVEGDVFQVLREYRDQGRTFVLIILDPPKFAYAQDQVESACRGYKDINLLAMQLIAPGGILFTFSCSGLVSPGLFQKVLFAASVDAARDVQIIEKLSQSSDHPILLTFPESEYLKGLVCRVV